MLADCIVYKRCVMTKGSTAERQTFPWPKAECCLYARAYNQYIYYVCPSQRFGLLGGFGSGALSFTGDCDRSGGLGSSFDGGSSGGGFASGRTSSLVEGSSMS